MANCYDNPVEAVELAYPLLIERYELIVDSGGAGLFRGGMGLPRTSSTFMVQDISQTARTRPRFPHRERSAASLAALPSTI